MLNTWVIGGTSGIGKAIAERLVQEATFGNVYASGDEHDVRKASAIQAGGRWAEPDTLVYAAGVNHLNWSEEISADQMKLLYDINVVGLIRALQCCSNLRRVLVIGSDAAWRPMRTSVAYCASKAALHMAVQVIARERGSDDFQINVLAPGKVEGTLMTTYVDERSAVLRPDMDHIGYQQGQIPGGRFCSPEEIAEVAVAVLNIKTPYLNGAVIPVNGGRS